YRSRRLQSRSVHEQREAGKAAGAARTFRAIPRRSGIAMKRLSLMQRAYLMGLRRARAQAQREMNEITDRYENMIAEIHAEMRAVRVELCGCSTTLCSPSAILLCG